MSGDRPVLSGLGLSRAAFSLALALGTVSLGRPAGATSLFDAIRQAYRTNPDLRGQRAGLKAVDEGYVQARAGLGPQVNLQAQGGYSVARVQQNSGFGASDSTFTGATGTGNLSIVQPVFTFGAASARVRGAKNDALAGRQTLRQTEAEVLGKVVTAYLDVRRDRETLKVLSDEITNLSRETAEIKAKGELGQLTRTDVAEAQSKLLLAQADYDLARGRVQASAAEYLQVVGENPDALEPEPDLPGMPVTIDDAFNAADKNSPRILEAVQSELAAREKINEAKAAYGPTVSLRVDAGVQPIEPYLPNVYDRNVTVAGVLSQPLFTSGMRASKVREATERDFQAQLKVEAIRREVVAGIAQAWSQYISAAAAEARSAAAVQADLIATEGNAIEERVGRRSPFELLSIEQELANARVGLLQRRRDKYLAQAQVLAAAGLLEARYLAPDLEADASVGTVKAGLNRVPIPWIGAVQALDSTVSLKAPGPRVAPGAGSKRPAPLDAPETP